jgi:hypothetical protein
MTMLLLVAAVLAAPPAEARCEVCGTWLLVDRLDRTPEGALVPEPSLGSDPVGVLVYDATGRVAVQLMKRDRSQGAAPPAPTAASAAQAGGNNSGASGGFDVYFGRYELDPVKHTVTHRLEGALAPTDVGKALVRSYRFEGPLLSLSFDTTGGGRPVRRTLRWRRAE